MKQIFFTLFLLSMAALHYQCNSSCTNFTNVRINNPFAPAGYEVLITADQLDALRGRQVWFGDTEVIKSRFIDGMGLAVTVPLGTTGAAQIRIEDADCGDVYVGTPFNRAATAQSTFGTAEFVFPVAPEIIIPSPPVSLPPTIDNAWFQPTHGEYCIWFKSYSDTIAATGQIINRPTVLDPGKSSELSTCGAADPALFNGNPITGTFDKDNNYIRFTIDRTKKGLGYEEFQGTLIDKNKTIYAGVEELNFPCPGNTSKTVPITEYVLLVTSLSSGRQLLLIHKK